MIDLGLTKILVVGAVALVVIGPERLPRVARTAGALLGRAQRYLRDLSSEVNRSIQLDEQMKNLAAMKANLDASVQGANPFAQNAWNVPDTPSQDEADGNISSVAFSTHVPRKNWRLKRSRLPARTPLWYRQRARLRQHVQSGAARVSRFRP